MLQQASWVYVQMISLVSYWISTFLLFQQLPGCCVCRKLLARQLLFFIFLLLIFHAPLILITYRLSPLSSPSHHPPLVTTYHRYYIICTHLNCLRLQMGDAWLTHLKVWTVGWNKKWHFYMSDMFLCFSAVFLHTTLLCFHIIPEAHKYVNLS